jgi:hypothetical protein
MPKGNLVDPLNEFIFNFSTDSPEKFVEEFVDFCLSNKNSYILARCFLYGFLCENFTADAIYDIKNILFKKIDAEPNIVKKGNLFLCASEISVGSAHALYYTMLIQLLKNINIISEFLDFYNMRKIAIYGYGEIGKRVIDIIASANKYSIECVIDKKSKDENGVIGIELLNEYAPDVVIVTPVYDYQSIKSELLSVTSNDTLRVESLKDIVYWKGSSYR